MLEVKNLTVNFAGLTAVDDLSFTVSPGTVFTLMGPNGAGKTTAFNAISGFVRPSSGKIQFQGQDIENVSPMRIAALGIRRTFQNNGILREMTVLENVLTGLALSTPSSFLGSAFGWPKSTRAEHDATDKARAALMQMGIANLAERPAGDLPFGQQRLVEIARAMVSGAQLLLLDEPAVGLSPGDRINLAKTLRDLCEEGVAILLVEHVQDLVAAVSDTILVLNYGKKIAQSTPSEIYNNKQVLEAYLGHV